MTPSLPRPVPDSELDNLGHRLSATRLPQVQEGLGWSRGIDVEFLADLLRSWREDYDWRVNESRILDLPWESVGTAEGELQFIHQRSLRLDASTVVLLHGWPDSVLRFERVLPLLTDLNVVVPALPGFPFAPPLSDAGMNVRVIASMIADAMQQLGYDRYVVSGGDVGGDVAEHLSELYPNRVSALHLTNISPLHAVFADRSVMTPGESAYLDRVALWQRTEGGYIAEQSTKPHTLSVGLADSPAGLAAWIIEKLHGWSDDDGNLDTTFSRDELLTWISSYWLTGCIGTSFSTYINFVPPVTYVKTPTVISSFAHDSKPAPREFAQRYVNVRQWIEHDNGGHFAAWEQPDIFASDLRKAISLGSEGGARTHR